MGKIALVLLVCFVGDRAPLVGHGGADVMHQLTEIVVILRELFTKHFVQLRIGRWVANSDVINGINDSCSKEVRPSNVAKITSKIRVLRRS